MRKTTYAFKYIPGVMERTQEEWRNFEQGHLDGTWLTNFVEFIPALGGCFVVLNYDRSPSDGHLPAPSRDAASLLEDFWNWQQQKHPIVPEGRSIMVVDDDQSILKLLRIIFENAGFLVRGFGDARAALEALKESDAPDVLVVDLRMPGMDGADFIRSVKASEIDSKVVIASAFNAKRAEAELGADASIDKPFLPDELIDLVHGLAATRT